MRDEQQDHRTDEQLLAAHLAGDRTALPVLVARHDQWLRRFVLSASWLTADVEVDDVVQEVWVRVLRSAHTFTGAAALRTWLGQIVLNHARDVARRAGVRRHESLPELFEQADRGTGPEEQVTQHAVVAELLALLSPAQRAAVVLVDGHGLSVRETAALLGVEVGTVKSRCARGRARMLAALQEQQRTDE